MSKYGGVDNPMRL